MKNEHVTFTVDGLLLYKHEMQQLLFTVFGLHHSPKFYMSLEGIDIVCRLDQFARFIIVRNEMGICNQIKSLNAKIVRDPLLPQRRIFNVTANQPKEPCDG